MLSSRAVHGSVLLLVAAAVGCGESPTDPASGPEPLLAASVAAEPTAADTLVDRASASDRELLLAVLARLDVLEARLGPEGSVDVDGLRALTRGPAHGGVGPAPGRGRPGQKPGDGEGQPGAGDGPGAGPASPPGGSGAIPPGVPFQLEAIRARLAVLEEQNELLQQKVNKVTVAMGLPVPADADLAPDEVFQTTSQVCMKLGTAGDVNLSGKFRTRTEGRGGGGIDFYGNKLLVEVRGDANGLAGASWKIIEGGVAYQFCVNAGRPEAQELMAALPFSSQQYETRFAGLASDMGELRTRPFQLMSPGFSLFDLEGYPSRSQLLSRMDGFFGGLRTSLCNELRSRYDIVDELSLGDGTLGGIRSPGVSRLQDRFQDDC